MSQEFNEEKLAFEGTNFVVVQAKHPFCTFLETTCLDYILKNARKSVHNIENLSYNILS